MKIGQAVYEQGHKNKNSITARFCGYHVDEISYWSILIYLDNTKYNETNILLKIVRNMQTTKYGMNNILNL